MTQVPIATARMNVSLLLALLIAGLAGLSAGADIAVASDKTSDTAPAPAPAAAANVAAGTSKSDGSQASAAAEMKPSPADAKPSSYNAPHKPRGSKKDSSSEGNKKDKNENHGQQRHGPAQQQHDNKQRNNAAGKQGRRYRRGIDGAQLALMTTLLGSQDSNSDCCDDSGKANTNDRLVDQINIVMAKLQNCKRNYYGYPYGYGCPYGPYY